jgi:hypothetical protein
VDAAVESIPLSDNFIDVLLSYNCLDHGWNVYRAIDECVRVSKHVYLAFDCRGDDPKQVEQFKEDLDHPQLLRFNNIKQHVFEKDITEIGVFTVKDMGIKNFPVAFIEVHKC